MTTGCTPPVPASAASHEVLVWCPVCGDAPGMDEHDGFCSRACRAASLDYHNRQEIEFDREMGRMGGYSIGGYVHDKTFDRKYAKPWRKRGNRA